MIKKILIIGGGVAGITAAHILSKQHRVTLIERESYLGGHTNTRTVNDPLNSELPVDTGFIVCNAKNYPNFYRFLDELSIARQDSDMSFGFSCQRSGMQYIGPSFSEFLRAPGNLLNPRFIKMILEQRRFNARALADLDSGSLGEIPLGDYLRRLGTSEFFFDNYLAPLIGSIWSAPDLNAIEFPALTFLTFFRNHGMLEFSKRPQWQTIVGGSASYVREFVRRFRGEIRLSNAARGVRRLSREEGGGIELITEGAAGGERERFDAVVLATHADEALSILSDPSPAEQQALGAWRYSKNRAVLHTDSSLLGPKRRLWAAWNYHRSLDAKRESAVAITYYMNRLQRLRAARDYFVTLNCTQQIDPRSIIYQVDYTHPVYTPQSPLSQAALLELNGTHDTFYCGAYMRYGFHEDAVWSALKVANHFGLGLG